MSKNTSATGSYEMQLNKGTKEVMVLLEGNFTEQQAGEFITEYSNIVKVINPSDYVLRIDCKDMRVVTKELVPSLEACYGLYKQSGFKNVIFEIVKSPIVKMQLARIARKVSLTDYEIVEFEA